MTNQVLKVKISKIRAELDALLACGDRESLLKVAALLNHVWEPVFRKDDGIRRTHLFQRIWTDEMAHGESSIFADISSVNDVIRKNRLIRQAFFRLENDFPIDMCVEAIQVISDFNLSDTAFREILAMDIEDEGKVIARIGEISKMALS